MDSSVKFSKMEAFGSDFEMSEAEEEAGVEQMVQRITRNNDSDVSYSDSGASSRDSGSGDGEIHLSFEEDMSDPFGSADEEEPPKIIDESSSSSQNIETFPSLSAVLDIDTLHFDVPRNPADDGSAFQSQSTSESQQATSQRAFAPPDAPGADDIWGTNEGKRVKEEDSDSSGIDDLLYPDKKKKKKATTEKSRLRQLNEFEASRKFGSANAAIITCDYKKAKSILLELIKDNPRKSQYYTTLGCVYEASGETAKALEVKIESSKLSGANADEWMQLGMIARQLNDFPNAEHCFGRAHRQDYGDPNPVWLRAKALVCMQDYDRAVYVLQVLLGMVPGNLTVLRVLADVYHHKLSKTDKIVRILEAEIQREKDNSTKSSGRLELRVEIVYLLCELYLTQSKYSEAEQLIKLVQSSKSDQNIPFELEIIYGICCLYLGRNDEADQTFAKLLQKNPAQYGLQFHSVALAYFGTDRPRDSLKFFRALDARAPAFARPPVWIQHGQCLMKLNHDKMAERMLRKVLESTDDDAKSYEMETRLLLSEVYTRMGKSDLAVGVLDHGLGAIGMLPKKTKPLKKKRKDNRPRKRVRVPKAEDEDLFCNHKKRNRLERSMSDEEKQIISFMQQKAKMIWTKVSKLYEAKKYDDIIDICSPLLAELAAVPHAGRIFREREPFMLLVRTGAVCIRLPVDSERARAFRGVFSSVVDEVRPFVFAIILERSKFGFDNELFAQMLMISSKMFLQMDKFEEASRDARLVIEMYPYSMRAFELYFAILSKSDYPVQFTRFLDRVRKKITSPTSPPLLLIIGHVFMIHRSYVHAANAYAEILKHHPKSPKVNMFLGISYLQHSQKRSCLHRHFFVTQAFAFLYRYLEESGNSPEALYNIGRAYHFMGIRNLALEFYEKVLRYNGTGCESDSIAKAKSDAAYNLAHM
eukprot:396506_1